MLVSFEQMVFLIVMVLLSKPCYVCQGVRLVSGVRVVRICATVVMLPPCATRAWAASDVRTGGQVVLAMKTRMNVWRHPAMRIPTARTLSVHSSAIASWDSLKRI